MKSSQTAGQRGLGGRRAGGQSALGTGGEVANLVIMSAAAANSTSSGKVEAEQHEITGVMKTPAPVPHGKDVGGDKIGDGGIIWTQSEGGEKVCWHALGLPIMIRAHKLNSGSRIGVSAGSRGLKRGL